MNQNTAGAVLVSIIATAGFVTDHPSVWGLAALTAALAFVRQELDDADDLFGFPALGTLGTYAALASWVAIIAAAIILML